MPLRDHFRPPLDDLTSWEGFHGQWPAMIVLALQHRLPRRYVAAPRVHNRFARRDRRGDCCLGAGAADARCRDRPARHAASPSVTTRNRRRPSLRRYQRTSSKTVLPTIRYSHRFPGEVRGEQGQAALCRRLPRLPQPVQAPAGVRLPLGVRLQRPPGRVVDGRWGPRRRRPPNTGAAAPASSGLRPMIRGSPGPASAPHVRPWRVLELAGGASGFTTGTRG